MPNHPDSEPAVERFTSGGGRYACTLIVNPEQNAATVRMIDVCYGYDADDPGTDEITLESGPQETPHGVQDWLTDQVVSQTVQSGFLRRRASTGIMEIQNAVSDLLRQFVRRHGPSQDSHK